MGDIVKPWVLPKEEAMSYETVLVHEWSKHGSIGKENSNYFSTFPMIEWVPYNVVTS